MSFVFNPSVPIDVSIGGNTAGTLTLIDSGTAFFAGGANITLSQNGQSITILGAGAGTEDSNVFGMSNLGNTSGTTGVVSGSALQYYFAGGNNVTLSQSINGSSGTLTFSVGNYLTTAMASNRGSDFVQAIAAFAGTNASGTIASDGISVSVGNYITTARASTDAIGLNTAKTNVTWTVNSSGLSFNAGGYAGTNTAVTNCSVTLNTSGISVNVPQTTISNYENRPFVGTQTMTFNAVSISHVAAFLLPDPGSFSFIRIPVLMTTSTGSIVANVTQTTAEGYVYSTWNAVVYTQGVGANSNSLQSYTSSAAFWTMQNRVSFGAVLSSTQYSITQAFSADGMGSGLTIGTSTQYSQSAASATLSSGLFTNFSSLRWLDIRFANSMSAGPYWLVLGYSSSSTTSGQGASAMTNARAAYSNHYGVSQANSWWQQMGDTAGSSGGYLGAGSFSTAGGGTTNSFAFSNISSSASNNRLYFQLLRSA